jgi:hypothetical protein
MATKTITKMTPELVVKALEDLDIPNEVRSDSPYLTYDDPNMKKKEFVVSLPEVVPYKGKRKEYLQDLAKSLRFNGYPAVYSPKSRASDQGEIGFDGVAAMRIVAKFTKPGLKPSDITPSITNDWILPETMVENVKSYISKIKLDVAQREQIIDFLDKTLSVSSNSSKRIEFTGEVLVPAEFFEILSAVKMAVLLRNNDQDLRNILAIPDDIVFRKNSPIKIYIPKKANYPLTDYEIAFLPSNVDVNKQPTFKVSVKSKVKSSSANTVKFKDLFKDGYAVSQWYQSLEISTKLEEYGPELIAAAAMKFYGRSGGAVREGKTIISPAGRYYDKVKLLFAIYALSLLIRNRKLQTKVFSGVNDYIKINGKSPTNKEVQRLGKALEEIYKKMGTLKKDDLIEKAFPNAKDKNNLYILTAFIGENLQKGGKPGEPIISNLIAQCEKTLEYMSRKTSKTKFNFFRMFYDKVLLSQKVAYAVTSKETVKAGKNKTTYIKYNFYSNVNWAKEYDTWIGLRRKDDKDMIGLDV